MTTQKKCIAAFRRAVRKVWWQYSPERKAALEGAKRAYTGENKRQKWEYHCNLCGGWFKQVEVQVDHIEECGKMSEYGDMGRFTERLFCGVDNLQVLCKECHKNKR